MTIAVCPGSYDPVTAGHLDVIKRCSRFFDEVHVVVAVNAAKTPLFAESTRVGIIRRALEDDGYDNITVASTDGLITDYCRAVGATVIVKGLRQNGDYEAELGMALVNRKLAGIETVFLPADPILEHISSSIVKDVARHGGDVTGMVPDCVTDMLYDALHVSADDRRHTSRLHGTPAAANAQPAACDTAAGDTADCGMRNNVNHTTSTTSRKD
ncbi:pantetheine-phosphate adenylyltransferase [Bifidobacterium jacchi]|uniref:Phosphopantetheine adenylyltransferase n=1 Tax=Bifidobacterium jacchi TaxID=2490545 RepID=A0A5N5RL88_9BIFI|nr:pantetheine-phosphate adenylyltransferase [Bifidobacterium jacchi]